MAPSRSKSGLLALILLSVTPSSARPQRDRSTRTQSPSSTITPSSSVTDAANATTSGDIPLTLWSIANSLITHYYSSTTVTNPATLTWPSTVVIEGSTYTMHSTPTGLMTSPTKTDPQHTTATALPSSEAARSNNDNSKDKKIGIILGVALGCVALALMAFLFWCLHRRKNDTGSFFMRRRTPSTISSGSGGSRGVVTFGPSSFAAAAATRPDPWEEKQARMAVIPARKPPAVMHPALLHHESSRSTSSDNPFYTPDDVSSHELDSRQVQQQAELDHHEPATRRSSGSIRDARPPTPFSPFEMMQMPGPSTLQRYQSQQHIQTSNPFSSPEDQEADDVISPILPSRSPERRYSPIIHYPSWSEVSEFDFAGEGRRRMSDAGDDGWRPGHDRGLDGRHELA